MSELSTVLAERWQYVQATAAVFESETPPRNMVTQSLSPAAPKIEKPRSPSPLSKAKGTVQRCSLAIEGTIRQQQSVASRLSSAASQACALSTSAADTGSLLIELSGLEQSFRDSLSAVSVQDFKTQAPDWLDIVKVCCVHDDARIVAHGWHLLLEVLRSKRLSDHMLTWLPLNFDAPLCWILQRAFSASAVDHVVDAVDVLMALAFQWPADVEADLASQMLLANAATLLRAVADASAALLVHTLYIDGEDLALLRLLEHVADGGIVYRKWEEESCIGAGLAAGILVKTVSKTCEPHIKETVLLAAGQLASLAAQSDSSEAIAHAAAVLESLLSHTKHGKFAALDARIKSIRVVRTLTDLLLCNQSADQNVLEQVALLGIPIEEVSTVDVALLWWILQLSPKALGVNVQTVDRTLSKRLIKMCGKAGLVHRLGEICLGDISVIGDGTARSHSLAVLIHFARASEGMKDKFKLLGKCFEKLGNCSAVDLLNTIPQVCVVSASTDSNKDSPLTIGLQSGSESFQTTMWLALHVWLPCVPDGASAWLTRHTFPVIASTLIRMSQCNGTRQPQDTTPYLDYLIRWYIVTSGEFVPVGDFFDLVCGLILVLPATPCSGSQGVTSRSELFLQAAAVGLDQCKSACHTPCMLPPELMLQKALENARCLMSEHGKGSNHIIAEFFSSALCCHHAVASFEQGAGSRFLASKVLPEILRAVGDTCAEDVLRSVESGVPKMRICRVIRKRLLQVASAHGGA